MPLEKSPVRLVDLCEPIFGLACDLNRLARNEGRKGVDAILNEVNAAFDQVRTDASRTNQSERQWKSVEPALCCFIDSVIEGSALSAARQWRDHRLAGSRFKILNGDDAFFDEFLDEELAQSSVDPDSVERLEVYFACLYLGFEGKYFGRPDELQRVQGKVAGRVTKLLGTGRSGKVTPEAYEHLNLTPLNLDSAPAIWGAAIFAAVFVILFFVGTGMMYRILTSHLTDSVSSILAANH